MRKPKKKTKRAKKIIENKKVEKGSNEMKKGLFEKFVIKKLRHNENKTKIKLYINNDTEIFFFVRVAVLPSVIISYSAGNKIFLPFNVS